MGTMIVAKSSGVTRACLSASLRLRLKAKYSAIAIKMNGNMVMNHFGEMSVAA